MAGGRDVVVDIVAASVNAAGLEPTTGIATRALLQSLKLCAKAAVRLTSTARTRSAAWLHSLCNAQLSRNVWDAGDSKPNSSGINFQLMLCQQSFDVMIKCSDQQAL